MEGNKKRGETGGKRSREEEREEGRVPLSCSLASPLLTPPSRSLIGPSRAPVPGHARGREQLFQVSNWYWRKRDSGHSVSETNEKSRRKQNTNAKNSHLTSTPSAGPALGRPRPRRVQVHQQRVQVERVRQDHAPDLRAAQRQRLERLRGPPPRHEPDVFEVRVHRAVDADDGALDDGAVLELDLDGLVDELGEEAGVEVFRFFGLWFRRS